MCAVKLPPLSSEDVKTMVYVSVGSNLNFTKNNCLTAELITDKVVHCPQSCSEIHQSEGFVSMEMRTAISTALVF